MKFKQSAYFAAIAAALALGACTSAPGQPGGADAATQAQADAAAQAAAKAQAEADAAQQQRRQAIAEANQNARAARFAPQTYASWNEGGANVTVKFLKNGRASWEEPGKDGKPFVMHGSWRVAKGQVNVVFQNKEEKKKESFSFAPKVALVAPAAAAADAGCKALPGLLPLEANGQTEKLDNIYLWPKAQLEKNQGSCVQQ